MKMINGKVIRFLDEIADLLERKGENSFKIRTYRLAARNIAFLDKDLKSYYLEERLNEVPGVGRAMEDKITEIIQTGDLRYLRRLREEIFGTQYPLVILPCREDEE